ncbi:glycosyltransferase [Emticicia sp. W12TSBA100-4]|uniref:glycosyltransferase n=1 Tax=Emticicia sp. W12TSBA100-4 TaxID=3160965 RepID=UPI003306062F
MIKKPILSICIPAHGRLEYVINTLESIFSVENLRNVELSEFEVIISDNDEKGALKVLSEIFKYPNFKYFQTDCKGFENSYFVLTYGNGEFLKLHNSQELWNEGSLFRVINLIKNNLQKKPLLFFTSGILLKGEIIEVNTFNDFIFKTSYFTSWSNSFGIWNEDFNKVSIDCILNKLFPHTSLLVTQHYKHEFKIVDIPYFSTQFVKKRGGHNKFQAFTVEYPTIVTDLFNKGLITKKTKKRVFRDLLCEYFPLLYFNVKVSRRETFSSEGFEQNLEIFFPKGSIYLVVFLSFIIPIKIIFRKIYLNYILKSKD